MHSLTVAAALLVLLVSSVSPGLAQTNISGSAFNCEPLLTSTSTAGSVHQLKPTDVQVVGAMGDSLTAGFGVLLDAEEIYVNRTDFRGLSWSIGEYIIVRSG